MAGLTLDNIIILICVIIIAYSLGVIVSHAIKSWQTHKANRRRP